MFRILWGLGGVAAATAGALYAGGLRVGEPLGCATQSEVAAYMADHRAKKPTRALAAGYDMAAARCTAAKLEPAMAAAYGPPIGWKAGLTSLPSQITFGVTEPVMGRLYRDMILDSGAVAPRSFGARPLMEADLLLVIGDAAVNQAATRDAAIAAVDAVRPFIELPDLAYARGEPVTAVALTANGVAARFGVAGAEIAVKDPAAMLAALEIMTVTITGADGAELSRAEGSLVLGHPIEALLWLVANGARFQPGDLVSVGSIGPLPPPPAEPGKVTARYQGLPGDPSVSVAFE